MNEYRVTLGNGEAIEVEAWTPEIAKAIAEEEAGQPVVSVEVLSLQTTEA